MLTGPSEVGSVDGMIRLSRGQVGRCHRPGSIDVTVKSSAGAGRILAPDPIALSRYHRGEIDWEDFSGFYLNRMEAVGAATWEWLHGMGSFFGQIIFLCYCPPDKPQCHTELLIRYLLKRFPGVYSVV